MHTMGPAVACNVPLAGLTTRLMKLVILYRYESMINAYYNILCHNIWSLIVVVNKGCKL